MFKNSLNQLILELEKQESLKAEVLALRKIAETPINPQEDLNEMGPAKDDIYTNKAPEFGSDTMLDQVGLTVGDRVKLVKTVAEIPHLPVGTVGTVANTETPEEGMIGVEWEQKIGYWNMLPEEIEKIKVVKTNTEASLNKQALYLQLMAVYQGENGLLQAPGLKEIIVPLDKLNHYIADEWSKNEMIGPDHKEQMLSGSSEGLFAFLVENNINIDDLVNTDYQFEITSQEDLEDYFSSLGNEIEAALDKESLDEEKIKIIQIFKTNEKKLQLFDGLVRGSVDLKEISPEDAVEWNEALAQTKLDKNNEKAWDELATIALKLFKKTREEK